MLDYLIYFNSLVQMFVVLVVLLAVGSAESVQESVQEIFGRLQDSGNWGEGISS